MFIYIIKRLLLTIPVLLGIATITFLLIYVIPGDPTSGIVGERVSPETLKQIRIEMGLDKPFHIQYISYLGRLIRGDLGRSLSTKQPVREAIIEKFPNTLKLTLSAMIIAVLFGVSIGIFAAITRGSIWDRLVMVLAVFGISTPVFWFGLLLIFIFSIKLGWLPISGMGDGSIFHLILPATTLGLRSVALIARITRTTMLETLGEDYIRCARAKGLKEHVVIFKHALKNSLIPIVTIIGLDFGSYLNGSVLTETVFGWPGLGRYAVEGIMKQDIPVVMGTVLFGAFVFVIVNLIVDILYHFLNPKIRVR
jgi:peptide/nickel transport system permease protein